MPPTISLVKLTENLKYATNCTKQFAHIILFKPQGNTMCHYYYETGPIS